MRKPQSQGVHHITIVDADHRTSIDFWEGVVGMPFVFEQPDLDNVAESPLMDSIYFTDPLGPPIELSSYRFEPPAGHTHTDVLLEAHRIRVERGDYDIAQLHLADAIEALVQRSQGSLSADRSAKDPYREAKPQTK